MHSIAVVIKLTICGKKKEKKKKKEEEKKEKKEKKVACPQTCYLDQWQQSF